MNVAIAVKIHWCQSFYPKCSPLVSYSRCIYHAGVESYQDVRVHAVCRVHLCTPWRRHEEYA